MYPFRWNEWNVDHVGKHGLQPWLVEYVVNHPSPGYPRHLTREKYLVWGQDIDGLYVQVIYIFDPPGVIYVLHARPLTDAEKRRLRRRRR